MEIKEIQGERITFYLTPTKTAFGTNLQFFIIAPSQPYYTKRMRTIRQLIELGVVKNISDLALYSNNKLDWVTSRKEWL